MEALRLHRRYLTSVESVCASLIGVTGTSPVMTPSLGLARRRDHLVRSANPPHRGAPLLQEPAHGRVGFEADRLLVGGVGRVDVAGSGEERRARRPIGLVLREAPIVVHSG